MLLRLVSTNMLLTPLPTFTNVLINKQTPALFDTQVTSCTYTKT